MVGLAGRARLWLLAGLIGDLRRSARPGVLALNSVGERLLALIARAGGPKFEAIESYVTLQRDGKRVKVLLSRVVHDPRENIFIRPNDVIFITREAPTFTALGALNQNVFGFNSEIPFDVETLTLAQAIGKAGGLNDHAVRSQPRFTSIGMRIVTSWRSSASTPRDLPSIAYRLSIISTCAIPQAICSPPVSRCGPRTSCTSPMPRLLTTTSC